MQDIVQAIGKVSWFGQCDVGDLQSVESERRERDRKIQLEREKRWKENRLAEDERRQQEEEDYQFALKEQEKFDVLYSSPSKTCGRGRGATISRLLESPPLPKLAQGRGRFARQSKNKDSSFRRELLLADDIAKTTGGEQIYRNSHQEQYWQGDNTVNYTLQDSCLNIKDFIAACDENIPNVSDYNHNSPTCVNNEDRPSSGSDEGACAPDHRSLYPNSTDKCDQYEDADSSLSSYLSVKHETPTFGSASSSVSASPVLRRPLPLPTGQLTRRPPRSRLAANFSNPIATSPTTTENSNQKMSFI